MKYIIFLPLVIGITALNAQTLQLEKNFSYPQTPTFIDQTQPGNNTKIDTVASLQKRQRMSSITTHRNRFAKVKQLYIIPGGLEPTNNYIFALSKFFTNLEYTPGTFSYSGPADGLLCVTNFAWGTENNNENFLPLLISKGYQDIKTPTYNFTWSQLPSYNQRGATFTPDAGEITLNYEFKIPSQPATTWGDDPVFNKFSLAGGGIFGKQPPITPKKIFCWDDGNLQTFMDSLTNPYGVRNHINLPMDFRAEGFSLDKPSETVYLAGNDAKVRAIKTSGDPLWEVHGRAPIIIYRDYLLTISPDYLEIIFYDKKTGKLISKSRLPDSLPRYENSFALISTNSGDMLIMLIPNQSRLLCYRIINKIIDKK